MLFLIINSGYEDSDHCRKQYIKTANPAYIFM